MVAIMTFPYDIRSNLTMLVDLLNTAGGIAESGDELTTTTGLRDFAARHDFSGPLTATKADVEATRRLRDRFDAAFSMDPDAEAVSSVDPEAEETAARDALERRIVDEVNLTLRETDALPQLVRHDDWDWHLHAAGAAPEQHCQPKEQETGLPKRGGRVAEAGPGRGPLGWGPEAGGACRPG